MAARQLTAAYCALWMSCALSSCAASNAPKTETLVTNQNLRALQSANIYGARLFHMSPPGPNFIAQMQQAIPRDYSGMDDGMRTAMANIERDLPYLSGFFANVNQQQLASLVKTYRAQIMAAPDPVEQQVRLAEVMAVSAMTAYRKNKGISQRANPIDQMQMDTLKYKQLQGGMRSYSPTCNPTRPDAASNLQNCHP